MSLPKSCGSSSGLCIRSCTVYLLSLEYGFSSLPPSLMGLVTIFSLTEQHESIDVGLRRLLERGDIESFIQRLFGHTHRKRWQGGEPAGVVLSQGSEFRERHDSIDQPDPVGFLCANAVSPSRSGVSVTPTCCCACSNLAFARPAEYRTWGTPSSALSGKEYRELQRNQTIPTAKPLIAATTGLGCTVATALNTWNFNDDGGQVRRHDSVTCMGLGIDPNPRHDKNA